MICQIRLLRSPSVKHVQRSVEILTYLVSRPNSFGDGDDVCDFRKSE